MRRIFRQRATQEDLTKLFGERKPKGRRPLTDLKLFGVIIALLVGLGGVGVAVFALLAWLAWDSHEFGATDIRYLLFVRGTLIERIGVIDARPGTLVYGGRGRDGAAPPYVRASYTSHVGANELFDRFVGRCKDLALEVRPGAQPSPDGSRTLSCGIAGKHDFHVHVTIGSTTPTAVLMNEDIEDGL